MSPSDRAARGRSCRSNTPRSSHPAWEPRADRPDPIGLLEEQAADRVPELVPIRYGRMSASPSAFYRGAAYVMASDLARTPRTGLRVQLCGDAHVANFGGFASAERQLLFDLVDFDGTLPRTVGMGREATRGERRRRRPGQRLQAEAAAADRLRSGPRVPAGKVVGVGSVGTRCWVILLLGRDASDPLFLQAKEAPRSVLERFAGRSQFSNQGPRVVEGQRLMQAAGDIFLGWLREPLGVEGFTSRDLYVRQLRDQKISPDVAAMPPAEIAVYSRLCAWTLARAHARSGDAIAIASYRGSSDAFDRALADFAEAYADQNERDHAALMEAIASGRVEAEQGV